MSLHIVKKGILDSIQDAGHYGRQHLGIGPGGVMDFIAFRTANALVGNSKGEAVLEMHFPGPVIHFTADCLIALSGADFGAVIDGVDININQPLVVNKGSILRFQQKRNGARCYLAVRGGLNNELFPYHFSGENEVVALPWKADLCGLYNNDRIRFVQGSFFYCLSESSRQHFCNSPFSITTQSNRMGYRLKGEALQLTEKQELVSAAVTKGTIQLLPNGQLIVLMADHQTTGGYPCIGHVISADIPSLAQSDSGQALSFESVSIAEAETLRLRQEQHLQQLQYSCTFRMQEYFSL